MSEERPQPDGQEQRRRNLRSLMSDSVYVAFGSYATQIFSLLIVTVLARKLSVETFGVYRVMLSTYAMGTMLLSLGVQPIIQRYLPELLARRDRHGAMRMQWLGAWSHLGASLLIAFLCWIFKDGLSAWLNTPDFGRLLPYFFLFVIFKFEAAVFEEMLTAHRSQAFRNIWLAIFQGLKLLLFWAFLPQDGSVETVMVFLVLSNLVLLTAFIARILGLSRRLEEAGREDLPWRRMIRFGLLRYTTTLTYIGFWTDIVVWFVTHFKGNEAAGLYGFAAQLVNHLAGLVPVYYLHAVIVPVYIKEYTLNQDKSQLIKVFRFFNKVVTVTLAPVLVGSLLLIGPITSEVFDPKFLPSVDAFRYLFLGMFVFYFFNTSSFLLVILERPEITLYSRVFVIYNIVMLWILIPRYGIEGAAVATGSANAFGYIFTYLMIKRSISISIPWLATGRIFLYTGVMALAVWPFMGWIDSLAKLLLVVLIGAVVYSVLVWRLPVFDVEERERLNTAIGRRIFPV